MNVDSLRHNKWVRRSAAALLVLLALWVVAWLAVPPIVKSQLQKVGSETLGRNLTVGRIDFKPWTLELTIDDLRIASADGSKSQLAIARIYANAELQSIVRLGPVIDTLTIDAPAVQLTHFADGKYDIDDIIAKLAAQPPEPEPSKKGEPPHFAIYNISVTGGSVDFDDQTVKRKHELREFVLKVPFLSNLASKRDIDTEPQLAFVLNGSRFDSNGVTTPFAQSQKTDVRLNVTGADLVPYLGYIPGGLPVALRSGKLDADLKIDFERAATAGLKVTGTVGAREIKAVDRRGQELLGFQSLKIALADVRPLERIVHLGEVALVSPRMVLAKDASGQLNLLATDPATGATEKTALPAAPSVAGPAPAQPAPAWRVQIDKVALGGGEIGWRDQTVAPAAAIDVKQLEIEVRSVAWPIEKPAGFNGSASVGGAAVRFSGEATDKAANAATQVDGLALSLAAPYLAQSLEPTLDGKLSGQIDVAWAAPALKLKARRLVADGLALKQGKAALASIGRFELLDAEADLANHTLDIASFSATNPKVTVERDDQKRWMFERWLKAPEGVGQDPKAASAEAAAAPADVAKSKPWALTIGSVAIDNGAMSFSDQSSGTPVAFELSAVKLNAEKIAPDTATASPVQLSGRIGAGRADAGRFDYKGTLVLKPLSAEGTLQAAGIPVHAFKAYYADPYNVDVRRAFASFRGNFKYAAVPAGINLKLMGDTALEDFRANSATLTQTPGATRGNQLLSWKTLSLRGLQLTMAPNAPVALDVRETTLTDFFARVIVDPTGRLNLQGLAKKSDKDEEGAAPSAQASTRRSFGGTSTTTIARPAARSSGPSVPAEAMVGGGEDVAVAKPIPAASASAEPAGLAPIISFGPMNLVNGRIDFTDLFVKPNYSADLSELTGKLSAFSSRPQGDKPALADLELRGKAQQTAQLDITGKLNPLAKPLELDITAKMRELDLPPLSPYAVRYAGHGIERGKLSMNVNYKIAPDGQLTATNKLVLNQLQFGEQVAGAPASLPVRLAVALLADRNGVIDVDLPLSGSLNDPQFSIGPLIFKAIVNLIVKAAAAPFNLLAGGLGGGGGAESSAIVFAPGSAVLKPEAKESLDKLAKALTDRPTLDLTMIGTASLDQEREAYQRERLRQLAQAEKRRAAVRSNQDAADVTPLTDAEYPELLTAIYKRADVKKPRNIVGLAKDVPTEEMEALLIPTIPVDEETMRQLALARGAAVRDYLLANKVPSERLFLGAVRTRPSGTDWKPEAELKLATR